MKSVLSVLLFASSLLFLSTASVHAAINPTGLSWSVQYMIDQSQTVNGKSQATGPRDNRGLALSPDGAYLYAGYNNGTSSPKQIRKIDLSESDYTDASVAFLEGNRGKALATDDIGRVYMAEGSDADTLDGPGIHIYNAALTTNLFTLPTGATYGLVKPEGVAVTRESGALVLYATDRTTFMLYRFVLTEVGGAITGATLAGLGGTGTMTICASPCDLRGVEVAPDDKIWMAGRGVNLVFRINNDGTGLVSTSVTNPMDVAFDETQAFVTQYTDRTIAVLNQSDQSLITTITLPLSSLKLGIPLISAFAGIVVKSNNQIFMTFEAGQTENEQSTYGRCDDQSNNPGGPCTITDLTHDDNDPIMRTEAPTALTLSTFNARLLNKNKVRVKWTTGNEQTAVGFNVYRAGKEDGKFKKLNDELIAAKHPGELTGDTYKFANKKVKGGKTYFYKLEILQSDGTSEWSEISQVKVR